ncbi:MAG TPA: ABC transporter permease subunit [Candidatus Thermoplasmatota archaeon]|nr:ABC transporter permease subunit [Candidatus Thermoplasmatota archaeon]
MRRGRILAAALALAAAWSAWSLNLNAARLGEAPGALARLAASAWPPHVGAGGLFLGEALLALLETLQVAFLATLFGALLSLPLALAAARNLAPAPLVVAARAVAAAIRVLPSLLWAILAVLVVGFGPLAGVVAMTLYTVGYLAKLQYEALEGVPRDALDAVRAMGATRFQQAWHVALPESGNALRSQLLFMLEYNVRGGLGQLLAIHLRFFDCAHVLTIVLTLFVAVAVLDGASLLLRRRFVELGGRRARWRDAAGGAARPGVP